MMREQDKNYTGNFQPETNPKKRWFKKPCVPKN